MAAWRTTCHGMAVAVCLLSAPVAAQRLDAASRAALGAEIAAVLAAEPEIVARALTAPPGPADMYRDAVAQDLDTIGQVSGRLFAPNGPGFGPKGQRATIALFTRADCDACARAEAELRALAKQAGIRVTLFDMDRDADLAARLELDSAPSYVMADRMLRGHMPAMVLERYISEARAESE